MVLYATASVPMDYRKGEIYNWKMFGCNVVLSCVVTLTYEALEQTKTSIWLVYESTLFWLLQDVETSDEVMFVDYGIISCDVWLAVWFRNITALWSLEREILILQHKSQDVKVFCLVMYLEGFRNLFWAAVPKMLHRMIVESIECYLRG